MEEVFRGTGSSVSVRMIGDGVLKSGLHDGILCSISVLLEREGGGGGAVLVIVMLGTEFLVDVEPVAAPETCDGALLLTLIIPFLMATL